MGRKKLSKQSEFLLERNYEYLLDSLFNRTHEHQLERSNFVEENLCDDNLIFPSQVRIL